jgi:release factor glutamine methyltransferase
MTLTVREVLGKTAAYFEQQGLQNPRLDGELLLGHVLGSNRVDLYLNHDRPLRDQELAALRELVRRRAGGEPVQYLTGETEFYSLGFKITPAALIPRPETEILVHAVLERLNSWPSAPRVADVGTGSGIIAIVLGVHLPRAQVWAIDRSEEALGLARENARRHAVADRIHFSRGDLLQPLEREEGGFAAIVSNPPYIRTAELDDLPGEIRQHEPVLALDGGADGLAVIRQLISRSPAFLAGGGFLALEIGAGQDQEIGGLLKEAAAFDQVVTVPDYSGIQRVILARRSPD